MKPGLVALPLLALAGLAGPASASAPRAVYTLAIGYNGVPVSAEPDGPVRPLHFADDDAAAFHRFGRAMSERSFLLSVMDAETQARFPDLGREARAPSLAELVRTVAELDRELEASNKRGVETEVVVFYSGHGTRGEDGAGALALLDGSITQKVLYDQVLAPLHARYVHLLIDACHAEAVVRPRDAQAAVVDVSGPQIAAYLSRQTLARFPHVGAIVASTSSAQAHEWDAFQGGVFTHEVLSGLRGAADVDGDHRVEYSELAAFLAAANRAVSDPRARLQTVVKAPALNPRVPIIDLAAAKGMARLRGAPANLGAFFIEDARGARLVDLRAEPGFSVELLLPAGDALYIRNSAREAEVRLAAGEQMSFNALQFRPVSARARDAIDSSLRRGLFATGYGPAYYRGFVDRQEDSVSVDLSLVDLGRESPSSESRGAPWAFGTAGALTVGAGVFGTMALGARGDYDRTDLERPAAEARDRYDRDRKVAGALAVTAVVAGAVGLYLWLSDR